MNRINNNADGGNRQIQPRDFSFLSEADQMLEKAIIGMALLQAGYPDGSKPVVIAGCYVEGEPDQSNTAVENFRVTPGIIAWKDRLWEFPGVVYYENGVNQTSVTVMFSHTIAVDFETNARDSSFDVDAAPSPVYRDSGNNNLQDMYVHTSNNCKIGAITSAGVVASDTRQRSGDIIYLDGSTMAFRIMDGANALANGIGNSYIF